MTGFLVRGALLLVVLLGGGEILVRIFIGSPSPQVYDAEIGYSYRPHAVFSQSKEGYSRFRFNALGLNDDEVGPKDGRCRVLVVGDSYTTSLQVNREDNFTSVAEALDPALDVVNGGRDGLFLGDVHKVVRRLAPDIRPDLVLYVISESDVEEDTQLDGFEVLVDPGTGEIVDAVMRVEDQEGFKEAFGSILRASALATRLSAQLQPSAAAAAKLWTTWKNGWREVDPVIAEAASIAEADIEDVVAFAFRRLAATADDAPTAILYINGLRYRPGHLARVAPSSKHAESIARRAAMRAGVSFYDTSWYLIEYVEASGQPPFGFNNGLRPGGHLNPGGHQAVARALVDLARESLASLPIECDSK